ncbi:CLC_0170 family protein [Clostridium sp. WILCCON 0269]|uniref:CLC_0170 family protein n=1 Tax=Candidatus Clostridium eludens TaxID=3381663 RepID=A0ABW8SK52_9CLOT
MRIVHLLNKYFFILMMVQGVFLVFIDPKKFKRDKLRKTALKSRIIGIIFMVFSTAIYIFSMYSF